jgi:LacI family transcriptional regulator
MTTIRQVAKACGVSPMTVSFVLNNRPGQVSQETRERVLRMVRDMGYRPSALKPSDRRLTNTLGIVTRATLGSLVGQGYFSRIFRGALGKADEMRQNVTLFTSSLMQADTHRSVRIYCDGRCDGLLVVSPDRDSPLVQTLQERGTPYVLTGSSPDDESIPSCDVDNSNEFYRITEYVVKLGHRRIAFCGGADFVTCVHQRYDGFHRALKDSGVPLDPTLSIIGIHIEHQTQQWLAEIMRRSPSRRPTAILAWDDGVAGLAMRTALDLGLRVPEDVSITGFNDDEAVVAAYPTLTTVRQPYDRIGGGAIEILLSQIKGSDSIAKRRLEPAELIIRGSAAPPSA